MSRVFCIGLVIGWGFGVAQGTPDAELAARMLFSGAITELAYALIRAMR